MERKEKERERENHTTDCGERQEESETLAVTFARNNSSMVIAVGSIPSPPPIQTDKQTHKQRQIDRHKENPLKSSECFPWFWSSLHLFNQKKKS